MHQSIRLALALHNHQPIGNFDGVFEQAYQDSYKPFLDVFERFGSLRISLHTSGSLLEWLDQRHPEYVDRLAALAGEGRIEILGGAHYEAILAMIPRQDRVGQIRSYRRFLESRLQTRVRGMWIPERVWEQSYVSDLAQAEVEYTLLDDFHFRNAGLIEEQLYGYFLTEDDGKLVSVFPGSERLRYLIPFQAPQATIDYLAQVARKQPGAVLVFGDDGEKFGTWPETKKHCYDEGWLAAFFQALVDNQSWIQLGTLGEVLDQVPPLGTIYLPDSSYREMTEWALPADRIVEYDDLHHAFQQDPRWQSLARFVRGGYWRNFKTKYPESNEMYARMMMVSRRLAEREACATPASGELVEKARQELYRGQCNCAYWHGAFGGVYLPHLRNAVYHHLIAADNLLDQAEGHDQPWIDATGADFNFDARQEVLLANDKLLALIAPAKGGMLYELDVRSIHHNLLATLARRPEAYHRKVKNGSSATASDVASIHDRVIFKQEGLDRKLIYDAWPRKSLLDHFLAPDATLEQAAAAKAQEVGDFLQAPYEARVRRNPQRIQVQLVRTGTAAGRSVKITKGLSLEAGSPTIEVAYLLEHLSPAQPLWFAVELNFSGLPDGADDRYFHDGRKNRLGRLESLLDLSGGQSLSLSDEWLGIDVALHASQPTRFWAFPIQTVSQSEGGFELVHQSVAVMPNWRVTADGEGRWSVSFTITCDTSLAESRHEKPLLASAAP